MPAKQSAKRTVPLRAAKTLPFSQWSKPFLAKLAETSNVAASARHAGVGTGAVYAARRKYPAFYQAWQEALCEGYDHLEMELLLRLRTGEIKRPTGAKTGVRVYENATSLRLLAAHKDSVVRQRAMQDNQNAAVVVAAINRQLDQMRQRALEAGEDVWAEDGDDEPA